MAIKPQEQIEGSRYKSFSKKQLQEFQEVETWLKNIGQTSHNVYLSALRKLCSWCGKDPHELIMERDQEIKSDDPIMRNGIRDLVLDFRHYLENQNYAPKTINATDGAVRSFFTAVLGRSGMQNVVRFSVMIARCLLVEVKSGERDVCLLLSRISMRQLERLLKELAL